MTHAPVCPDKPWLQHYDPAVPPALDYPAQTLPDILAATAARWGGQPATIFAGSILSYSRLEALSTRLAQALLELGLQRGDRVGLVLPNCPQFILAFYAILKAGGVVAATNPLYRERELAAQLQDAGVTILIGSRAAAPVLHSVRPELPLRHVIWTDLDDAAQLEDLPATTTPLTLGPDLDLLEILAAAPSQTLLPQLSPADRAVLQYTGGTTGTPKGAIGLHANLAANTLQFRAWLAGLQDGREVALVAIPLFHVYGMVIGMSVSVALGAAMVLLPNGRDIDAILQLIEQYRVTLFPGVPTLYHAVNHHPRVLDGGCDLRSVRACISGSAPLPVEVKARFEALTGGKVMEGYGLSEAPTATHCNPMLGENRPGSIGLPLPDVSCCIVSMVDGRTILPPGEVGELLIRGPQVMPGYHNQPQETAVALADGWLHTGDIARMDAEGYFYLVGRKKELIKVSGYQVWPAEVEAVIATHPAVREVGVAGVPDEARGEVVRAWVVLQPGREVTADEIRQWCLEQLAHYKAPQEVVFVAALPRTPVGKLLRRELNQLSPLS